MVRGLAAVIYSTLVTQAAGCLLLVLLLLGFYRDYRKAYLLDWCRSWVAFAIYLSTGALGLLLVSQPGASPELRALNSTVSVVASLLQVGYLALGADGLIRGTVMPKPLRRVVVFGALGVAAAILLLGPLLPVRPYELRTAARAVIAGGAFVVAGIVVGRGARGLGRRLVGVAFAAYGLAMLLSYSMNFLNLGEDGPRYVSYLGFGDIVIQWMMGIGMVVSLLENERAEVVLASQKIHELAYHDVLTGLPNRALFTDRLETALRQATRARSSVVLCYLDMDGFKVVNDSLGHTTGDHLLIAVASRLSGILRGADTLARLGGDEFTVIVGAPGAGEEDVPTVARKLVESFHAPFDVDGQEIFVTASVGVSVFPQDAEDAATLLRNADAALYRAKEEGRDCFRMYTEAMNARALERLKIEADLRNAVRRREFEVHYQPLQDLHTGEVRVYEALVRWNHPERGLLQPGQFIGVAEHSGLIDEIGRQVLDAACAYLSSRGDGPNGPRVAVNVSTRQFLRSDIIDDVQNALGRAGLAASRLELEITESVALLDFDGAVETIRKLRALGVRVSLDDFGTGQSSLTQLQKLPIDAIKIDRSFVAGLGAGDTDARIVESLILLAKSLGLQVVAEGVETEAQLDWLKNRHCDLAQGYLLGRPVPPG